MSRPPAWDRTAHLLDAMLPDLRMGLDNLLAHKLRSLLTMLGMIFGVAAVLAMLSIGAGAQQQVLAFIEALGVRNLIVEAVEAQDMQALRNVRDVSPGLGYRDLRIIRTNVAGIAGASARKRIVPGRMLPRIQGELPTVYGVTPEYLDISGLRIVEGRFFDADETARAAPVCVLGEAARARLFGSGDAVGEYIKVNEQWLRVIGVAGPQLTAGAGTADVPTEDRNHVIYAPIESVRLRLADTRSRLRDEIDGLYLQVAAGADPVRTAQIVRGLLDETHGGAADYRLIVPAELLAEQQRTRRIFQVVMVAIASISLLVGGIGIMNIMLAGVLERTREIGLRRAVGARQRTIVRQFLTEASLIAGAGGLLGVGVGLVLSRIVALFAGWTTVVTVWSVLVAVLVSVAVGLVFGVYPARKAARLDPVVALHYE